MQLNDVVPWGRSFDEYRRMFALSGQDLDKRILGAADGPACFNAELARRGGRVVSVDPLYRFSARQIRTRIDAVYPEIMAQMHQHRDRYLWTTIDSPQALGGVRTTAMEAFLADYEAGRTEGRYVNAALPALPFEDLAFDLALCSHYLFLYSEQIDEAKHIAAMRALCRVAAEVRVFPLLSLDGTRSEHIAPVANALEDDGIRVEFRPVDYAFQRGADQMLVARSSTARHHG